jgi:hypothetical protein
MYKYTLLDLTNIASIDYQEYCLLGCDPGILVEVQHCNTV